MTTMTFKEIREKYLFEQTDSVNESSNDGVRDFLESNDFKHQKTSRHEGDLLHHDYKSEKHPGVMIRKIESPRNQQWYGSQYRYEVYRNGEQVESVSRKHGKGPYKMIITHLDHLKSTLNKA